jgi:lysophospholipase L1-like esterase
MNKHKVLLAVVSLLLIIGCNQNTKREYYDIPLAKNIQVDGNPDDWRNQGLRIPLVADLWGNFNSESFSATVSLAWDENYLYLLAEVADDVVFQDNTGPLWRNDGLEVFLAARKGSGQIIQYLVAPAVTDAFPNAGIHKRNIGQPDQTSLIPDLQIGSQRKVNGYTVELGIPFSSLGLSPVRGDTIAFNFYIGDSDSPQNHVKYSWHYNDNTYLNSDALYHVVLSGKGTRSSVLTRASLTDTTFYSIKLISEQLIDGEINLLNGDVLLAGKPMNTVDDLYMVDFSFEKTDSLNLHLLLRVLAGDVEITTIEWLDIPRRYVNIPAPGRFENEILLFEKQDSRNFPPRGATLFVGSSSIRLWRTIEEDLPGLTIINRGFGGSQTDDVLHHFDRIVAPYYPKTIVYFTGTNDLASGRTPEETVANVEEFIVRATRLFPDVTIYILSNTIAVSRKHLHERMSKANRLLVNMLENHENALYVDVTTPGLLENGQPRPDIYTADSLHLNRLGYEMWGDVLRPYLGGE